MMWKLRSENGFIDFMRRGGAKYALLLLVLGLALLLLCGGVGESESVATEPDEEARISEMCSLTEGVGECRVMLTYDGQGRVCSVAVLCEGADSVEVRRRITDMLSSLYGIGSNRISVLKITDKKE